MEEVFFSSFISLVIRHSSHILIPKMYQNSYIYTLGAAQSPLKSIQRHQLVKGPVVCDSAFPAKLLIKFTFTVLWNTGSFLKDNRLSFTWRFTVEGNNLSFACEMEKVHGDKFGKVGRLCHWSLMAPAEGSGLRQGGQWIRALPELPPPYFSL